MRLIDADVLIEAIKNMSQRYCDCKDCDGRGQIIRVSEVIDIAKNEVSTAYSVDNVIEELERAKHEICLYGDDLEHYQNGIDEAIEIVKKGSVSDDVCKWEYNDTEYCLESSCNHLHIFMDDCPKQNEYSFCPYCGKKIKVVE